MVPQVKHTLLEYINELIILNLDSLVNFKNALCTATKTRTGTGSKLSPRSKGCFHGFANCMIWLLLYHFLCLFVTLSCLEDSCPVFKPLSDPTYFQKKLGLPVTTSASSFDALLISLKSLHKFLNFQAHRLHTLLEK